MRIGLGIPLDIAPAFYDAEEACTSLPGAACVGKPRPLGGNDVVGGLTARVAVGETVILLTFPLHLY